MDSDISSLYKERRWGKEEGGENVTDGFVFRGKKAFENVLKGLKENLEKGFHKTIEGVEFRVLDSRKKGVELEIEIEIVLSNKKGVAVLKLYGPNRKKENVVTVSRSKGSEPEFVEILAEKILKPLMDGFLRGDSKIITKLKDVKKVSFSKRKNGKQI